MKHNSLRPGALLRTRPTRITRRQQKHDMLLTFMSHARAHKRPAPITNALKTLLSLFV
jgi:hypothetical protein